MAKSGAERQRRFRDKAKKDKGLIGLQVRLSPEVKAKLVELKEYLSMNQGEVVERALLALDRNKETEKALMVAEKSAELAQQEAAKQTNLAIDALMGDDVTL